MAKKLTSTVRPWNLAKCQKHINRHILVNLQAAKTRFEPLVTVSKNTCCSLTAVYRCPKPQGQILTLWDRWRSLYNMLTGEIRKLVYITRVYISGFCRSTKRRLLERWPWGANREIWKIYRMGQADPLRPLTPKPGGRNVLLYNCSHSQTVVWWPSIYRGYLDWIYYWMFRLIAFATVNNKDDWFIKRSA